MVSELLERIKELREQIPKMINDLYGDKIPDDAADVKKIKETFDKDEERLEEIIKPKLPNATGVAFNLNDALEELIKKYPNGFENIGKAVPPPIKMRRELKKLAQV